MNTVTTSLGDNSYDIHIGCNILQELGAIAKSVAPATKHFFVVDKNVEQTHAKEAMQAFGGQCEMVSLDAIESNKTMASVESIWSSMLDAGCDRHSELIAIGGGLTGDVGGFAAATYMRGLQLIQVPTSLLAMVDASIGGKTGVNLPIRSEDGTSILGKNLAGSFWQPKVVVADVMTLQTLDDRQLRCGLAECIKHAILGHQSMMDFILENTSAILDRDSDVLVELVTKSASIKAKVVSQDEREHGDRALLNLGHTFAHAIEPMRELDLYHGEAVSIGLVAAVTCAEAMGLVDAERVDQIRHVLTMAGLPVSLPLPVSIESVLRLMQIDKKNKDSNISLVLPTNSGAEMYTEINETALVLAWTSVGASA